MKRYAVLILFTLILFTDLYSQVYDSLNSKTKGQVITLDGPQSFSGSPLYIIKADNKIFQTSKNFGIGDSLMTNVLNYLNPDWIQSIDVLKNTEATDRYGSLGENGVIVITFKKGMLENTPIDFKKRFKEY